MVLVVMVEAWGIWGAIGPSTFTPLRPWPHTPTEVRGDLQRRRRQRTGAEERDYLSSISSSLLRHHHHLYLRFPFLSIYCYSSRQLLRFTHCLFCSVTRESFVCLFFHLYFFHCVYIELLLLILCSSLQKHGLFLIPFYSTFMLSLFCFC